MFTGTLRDFQKPAVAKMVDRGAVLVGYDMGLGKTVISIAAVEELLDSEKVRGGLVVCSASLKFQWRDELAKFTDGALVLVIDGDPKQRALLYKRAHKYEYVILTYNQVVDDWNEVRKLERDFVILDEAVAIKSFITQRTKKVKRLDAAYRFALTGQPLENRPEEVFSIMEWIDDSVLGDFEQFDRTFIKRNDWGGVKHYRNLTLLHESLAEAMVRKKRTDPDVASEMPAVQEDTILMRLDGPARELYTFITEALLAELQTQMRFSNWDLMSHYGKSDGSDDNAARGRIMSKLTCLRMLCDHPELIRRSAKLYDGRFHTDGGALAGSAYASELVEYGHLDYKFGTPKLDMLTEEIDQILSEDPLNKVVVFSFFKGMLDLIDERVGKMTGTVKFTGDLNAAQRHDAKVKFQKDPRVRVFLSSDAGGVGVDLPQANYLCNVDLPWSAGAIDQRNARIIRLSSEWDKVYLMNFLARGSIEQRIYALLEQKRMIASAIVDGKGIDAEGNLHLDLGSLTEYLMDTSV